MLIDDIKVSLRLNHYALDSEISDLIEAARLDLSLSGVSISKANDEVDPLIKRAITTYVKANFIPDGNEAERFQRSYDMLKNHLTLAGDYQ
jgi:uncharacterized phage protein (predicted DNA packaging)